MPKFKGTVSAEFIARRDKKAGGFNAGIRGADAEFIEHHQVLIDPFQSLYEGYEYDTFHSTLGRIDYKQYSKAGIKLGEYTQRQIREGMVQYIGIWKWLPNNHWEELHEGKVVQYEILDYVDAKEALKQLNDDGRFPY